MEYFCASAVFATLLIQPVPGLSYGQVTGKALFVGFRKISSASDLHVIRDRSQNMSAAEGGGFFVENAGNR